jgi:hypothetical protein
MVSGVESDGLETPFCGGGTSGKVRAVKAPKCQAWAKGHFELAGKIGRADEAPGLPSPSAAPYWELGEQYGTR